MKKIFLLLTGILAACSSIKKDYVVTDVSYSPKPKWVKKQSKEEDKEYKYFVSTADNVNQRLCQKGASARANAVIASEILKSVNNNYKSLAESNNEDAKEFSNEELQQNVNLNLAGVIESEYYWEKRKYSKELGAEKDITKYTCYSMLKMSKVNYEKAVSNSLNKMLEIINKQ